MGMAPLKCEAGGVGGSRGCTRLPRLASAMLQKINGWICQEDIKEDNKRPFLANISFRQTMLWGRRRFPPQDRTGVLGITGYRSSGAPSGKSPGLVRKSHIFHRKNSISCHSNCLQQEQVTLPGGEAYGEIRSPPKAPGTKASRCTHTRRGRSLSAQGDQEAPWVPMWCRLPALSKLTPGSSVSHRETCDVVVNCVSPLHGTAATGLLV